jgi:NADP-dependent 3-hydroxy acid dehydrogenase YdfG
VLTAEKDMNIVSSLTGQIAVVTGGSGGIGQAIALGLAREGATLCLIGRDPRKLELVADCARQWTKHISIHEADLEIDEDIRRLSSNIESTFGAIDILINGAGVIISGTTEESRIEDFDHQYRINVRAAYLLTKIFLPMLKLRHGQIVFMNSTAGLTAKAGVGQYSATKHALRAVADSLREEVNADDVRVISVYPGRTAGVLQENLHGIKNMNYRPEMLLQPEDLASVVMNALNMPRTAEVTDIWVRPMKKHET